MWLGSTLAWLLAPQGQPQMQQPQMQQLAGGGDWNQYGSQPPPPGGEWGADDQTIGAFGAPPPQQQVDTSFSSQLRCNC